MTEPPDPVAARRRSILLVLGAAGAFSLIAAVEKGIGSAVPVAEVLFVRNLFALLALLPVMMSQGGLAALQTSMPLGHVLRMTFGLLNMAGAFYGYIYLPLETVTALGFAMPLFLTILSVPLLGERIRLGRGLPLLVGLCGVLLIVGSDATSFDGNGFAIGVVLLATLSWALSMITIRRMGEAGESGTTIVLWYGIGGSIVWGLATIPNWVWPTPLQWLFMIGLGLFSAAAQLLMTNAYRSGEASLLAPFEYSAIIWTTGLGLVIWGEYPTAQDLVGVAVLIGAGMLIWYQELRMGIRR